MSALTEPNGGPAGWPERTMRSWPHPADVQSEVERLPMPRLTRGQAFDAGVCLIGVVATSAFALPWIRHMTPVSPAYVVVALSVVVLAQFPLELRTRAGEVVIGFEAAALVFLSLVVPLGEALAFWLIAMVVAHGLVQRKEWNARVFNVGCTSLSGVPLAVLVAAGRGHGQLTVLVMMALGCASYFVVDMLMTATSLAVMEWVPISTALPMGSALLPLVIFVGIDSLGYLAALVDQAYSDWALLLLVVPIGTILVAAHAVARARISERRTAGLLAIAQSAGEYADAEPILGLLVGQLQKLLPSRAITMRPRPPGDDEIGRPIKASGQVGQYLVVSRGPGAALFQEDERDTVEALVTVAGNALERQRLMADMTWLARFDPLTRLANRPTFVDRLAHALHLVRRRQGLLAVLYCDLDGFKGVNDRFGHEIGDQVLIEVASRLQATLRVADTPARFGGDEFVVLAEDVPDPAEAVRLGERIVAAISAPIAVHGHFVTLGVSIGIAATTGDAEAEVLLHDADMAMYRAKATGKNCVEFFDPEMRRQSEQRLQLEDALRVALDEHQLTLAVQPVVDLRSGVVDGFEALLRWTHPDLGYISPEMLLSVAEGTGLTTRLGRWVLHEAYRHALLLGEAAGRPVTMAVNVAAEQLADESFLTDAETMAADPRARLVFELTERALVEESAAASSLRRLHDAGIAIAIDDFGVGYSSISYLHRFDCIDIVKIDRSFVQSLAHDNRTAALVDTILAMARAFNAAVVAEGIEDHTTCRALREANCALGQGFLFSPAVPVEDAVAMVRPAAAAYTLTAV